MRGSTNAQVVQRNTDGISIKDMRKTMGVAPAQDMWSNISILDKNGQQIGTLSQIQFPNGAVRTAIGVRKDASNNTFLCLQMMADGGVEVFVEKTKNGVYSAQQIMSF